MYIYMCAHSFIYILCVCVYLYIYTKAGKTAVVKIDAVESIFYSGQVSVSFFYKRGEPDMHNRRKMIPAV